MSARYRVVVSTPNNLEGLLLGELTALGLADARETRGAVTGEADLATVYAVLLGSRLASRVLLPLTEVPADTADALYTGVSAFPWEAHLVTPATIAVHCHGRSDGIRHTRFGAQRVKDAIADRLRGRGESLQVDTEAPDIRLSVRIRDDRARLALDLSGDSLHRRGYRRDQTEAPLKEPLAAAVLMRAGWPEGATAAHTLFDPCCGSGTLLLEGAMMAADMAPGLLRERFGTAHWRDHDPALWEQTRRALRERVITDAQRLPRLVGHDRDPRAVAAAEANLRRLGLTVRSELRQGDLTADGPTWPDGPGTLATNPPYGHRLEANSPVERLYMRLGDRARAELPGWRLAVLTTRSERLSAIGLRSRRVYRLFNGALPCRLGIYDVHDGSAPPASTPTPEPAADVLNRLRKNERHLARWRRREHVSCYRVYDADIPEYAMAVDIYEAEDGRHAHVQEYEPPARIAPRKAEARRQAALAAVAEAFALPPERVHLKIRRRRTGGQQYGRQGESGGFHVVHEGAARLRVNFDDYLDTGLFLDHRPLRARLREAARGKRLLNLFAYTGAITVQAALGGAATTSVDLSRRYLAWAEANLALNGLEAGGDHRLISADVVEWLDRAARGDQRWDIIVLDPPTHSRSKRMAGDFDIQRDHSTLLQAAARVLATDGTLYFSTNHRHFRLDDNVLTDWRIREITGETLPADFARGAAPHRCWRIDRGDAGG